MTAVTAPSSAAPGPSALATVRRQFRDRPLIPLVVLLLLLVVVSEIARPGIVSANWVGVMLRGAVPLAILVALLLAAVAGLVTGIGVGVFRVHPLIMTLGMSLVVLGLANVWQIVMVQTGAGVPEVLRTVGVGLVEIVPYNLLLFVPLAALVLIGLRRTGFGRLLYAIGDNPIAARLSGARSWQVLVVLYIISAVFAAIAGFLVSGLNNVASVTLVDSYVLPSVAAAVIGGTSILGGRGGYAGTIVGALILTVLTSLLTSLGLPEAVRQVLFGSIIVAVAAAYTRVTSET